MSKEFDEAEAEIKAALNPEPEDAKTPASEEKPAEPHKEEPAPNPAPEEQTKPAPAEPDALFEEFKGDDEGGDYDAAIAHALNALQKGLRKTISRDEIAAMIKDEIGKAMSAAAAPKPSRTMLARPDGRGGNMDPGLASDDPSGDEQLAAQLDAKIRDFNRA